MPPKPAEEGGDFSSAQALVDFVLKDVSEDSAGGALDEFRAEFEKLAAASSRAFGAHALLRKKGAELEGECSKLKERIIISEKESVDAQERKARVQAEIEATWAQVADMHKREGEKRTKSVELKQQIQELNSSLGVGSGWSDEQELQMKELQQQRGDIERDVEAKMSALGVLRTEVGHVHAELEREEEINMNIESDIEMLKTEVDAKVSQTELNLAKKEREEKRLVQLKERVEVLTVQVDERGLAIEKGEKDIATMETRLRDAKTQMERYLREYDGLFRKTHKLTEELGDQMHQNQLAAAENTQRAQEVERKRGEVAQVRKELARVTKLKDATAKMMTGIEADKEKVETEREALKAELKQLTEIDVVRHRKEGETLQMQNENLSREREILNKKITKASDKSKVTFDLAKIQENTRKNLDNEVRGFKETVQEQRDMVQQLVQDRERYEADADEANQKFYTALEELKLQEMHITALQKKIAEGDTRLKQQQNLYEQVRSDRNLYSKQLIESQDEIASMRRKFKILNHQIEQLKEEISTKDHHLVREHFEHHKVDKEKEALKNELTRIRKQIQSSEQIITNQQAEVQKLTAIISEADGERSRQNKEVEAVRNEHTLLNAQLVKRRDELRKLYDNIKTQKALLAKGAAGFEETRAEVSLLKERIAELGSVGLVSKEQVQNIQDLRNEVFRLQRELLQERTKIKALSEELERPLNVHRWRKLESSDPQLFDHLRKVQALQKQLIERTDEVVEKDLLIQEKEKLYVELKQILARQPGEEVAEQLAVYQQNLKEKQQQMKAMNSELQMYKSQLSEYKYEIGSLNKSMDAVKGQWFAQQREAEAAELVGGDGDGGMGAEDAAPLGTVGGGLTAAVDDVFTAGVVPPAAAE